MIQSLTGHSLTRSRWLCKRSRSELRELSELRGDRHFERSLICSSKSVHREDPFGEEDDILRLEQDVIVPLASARKMFVYESKDFWRQVKTAGCVACGDLVAYR
jgi:mannose-1-phosphate guanylyltransferase